MSFPFTVIYVASMISVCIGTYYVTISAIGYSRSRGLFGRITGWQRATFKSATTQSIIIHLSREISELQEAYVHDHYDRHTEIADCIILLYGLADRDGLTYDDLMDVVRAKMAVNMRRKWKEPDDAGVVEHVDLPTGM